MRFLPRRFTGPVWDCRSAVPSLHRITAACGPPTTLRAAQVFTSFCPPVEEHERRPQGAPRCSSLMTMTLCVRPVPATNDECHDGTAEVDTSFALKTAFR